METSELVAQELLWERQRQQDKLGWVPEHDDEHKLGEIAGMAALYALPPNVRMWDATSTGFGETLGEAICPYGWVAKPGDRRRELVKAGALIIAEIERLDRIAPKG